MAYFSREYCLAGNGWQWLAKGTIWVHKEHTDGGMMGERGWRKGKPKVGRVRGLKK
jgi:hypothetical protein